MTTKTKKGITIDSGFIHPREFNIYVNLNKDGMDSDDDISVIVSICDGKKIKIEIDKDDVKRVTENEQKEICDLIMKGIKSHKILLPIFISFDLYSDTSEDEIGRKKEKFDEWEYDWDLGK